MSASSDIGSALRHYRAERSMSQTALAALLGINQSQISRWERGLDTPRFGKMQRIRHLIREDMPSVHRALSRFVEQSSARLVLFNDSFELIAAARALKQEGLVAAFVEGVLRSPAPEAVDLVARARSAIRQPGGASGVRIGVTVPAPSGSGPVRLDMSLAICAARGGILALGELIARPVENADLAAEAVTFD